MIAVSDAWKNAHKQKILPETFVDITMGIGTLNYSRYHGNDLFRSCSILLSEGNINLTKHEPKPPEYLATLEENLWLLDGTRNIRNPGGRESYGKYVSDKISGEESYTFVFDNPITEDSPGITIMWSTEYNEYPTQFRIDAYLGDTVVATTTITGNDSPVSFVELELTEYDKIILTLYDWNLPNHRHRIDVFCFGLVVSFDKNDILSYTHEQSGDLLSGAMPKNSITFSVSNIDGKWNLHNPSGVGRYLTERQKLAVRYGMNLDGAVEWIPGGTFFLTEWDAPSNGLEAKFVASDILPFFLNILSYPTGIGSHILHGILDTGVSLIIDRNVEGDLYRPPALMIDDEEYSVGESIQYQANMNNLIFYQDRDGIIQVKPLNNTISDYVIPLGFAYSHPEVRLSKQLKGVSVKYRDYLTDDSQKYCVLSVSDVGETQTVENPFVYNYDIADSMARHVTNILSSRKTVSGEFRADPRLDVFDIVEIESKYGTITPVVITNIKYVYNGSFRGYYEGRVVTI